MDALVEREYENIISDCKKKLDDCNLNANWFLPFVFTLLFLLVQLVHLYPFLGSYLFRWNAKSYKGHLKMPVVAGERCRGL